MSSVFAKYTDKYNLLVGSKEDPGDSCHRTCMYIIGRRLHSPFENTHLIDYNINGTALLFSQKYIRHPSEGWWSEPDRFSRDQAIPFVIYMSKLGLHKSLFKFMMKHIFRLGLFWNTRRNGATPENHGQLKYSDSDEIYNYNWKLPDGSGPEFWALYIRGFRWWLLYPLLCLFDLETVFSAIKRRIWPDNDPLNHVIVSVYSNRVMPTPCSKLVSLINDKEETLSRMRYYFDRVGMPEMVELWKPLI